MATKPLKSRVKELRELVDSLGPAAAFRKMHGILKALEMQVEDGRYQRHAVTRLCEALLATAELYSIPQEEADRLEALACGLVDLVESQGGRG